MSRQLAGCHGIRPLRRDNRGVAMRDIPTVLADAVARANARG